MRTNKELADHIFLTTNPSYERDQIINALYAADALDKARDEIVAHADLFCSDQLRQVADVIAKE